MTTALIIAGLVLTAIIWLFVGVVLPHRERGNEAYRTETRQRIDDSLGTWAPESMIARDRQRGRGTYARHKGVRE